MRFDGATAAGPAVRQSMMAQELKRQQAGGILTLTLDVAGKKNALTSTLREALLDELRSACADDTVKAIVLTGAGGAFSSGGDIALMGEGDAADRRHRLQVLHEVVRILLVGPKPVVTAVSGVAYGGGFSLALAGDYVVADTTARFCASFGRIGLTGDMGLLWSLPRRVGAALARQLVLDERVIEACEARSMGIVDVLAEPQELYDTAIATARAASAMPGQAIAETKALTASGLDMLLEAEMEAQMRLFESRAHVEARETFLKRRRNPVPAGR